MATQGRLGRTVGLVGTLSRAGVLARLRPDKYVRMAQVVRRDGVTATTGVALAARRRPDGVALIDDRGALTWAELDRRCDALAAALAARHGAAPLTIGILARNHRGFVETLVAAGRLGADAILLNTGFAAPQLADVLEREGVDVLVCDQEFESLLDVARDRGITVDAITAWVDDAGDGPTLDQLIDDNLGTKPEPPERSGRIVLLTSGTTGAPKGARRSGGGDVATLATVLDRIPWHAEETIVVAAPMFHAWGFGQVVLAATMTCTVVTTRRFDAERTLALLAAHRATGLAVVPVMLERIAELSPVIRRRYDTSALRFVTSSGSRMQPSALVRFMDEFGDVVYNSYNATEVGMIACATPADLRAAPTSAGRPFDDVTLRLLDADGREVPQGEVGRIFVRSGTSFDGYSGGEEAAFDDGFMESRDVGYLDEDGRLHVVGRDDEMIVSGGENVYPREVEETLTAHPQVREASVLGVDDDEFGQRLVAFVALADGATATDADLKAHVREHLARYKVPRDVTVLDELPRNSAGKIVRSELTRTDSPAR